MLGNTPVINITHESISLYVKLEYYNPMGSIKDRAANYILDKLLKNNVINLDTKIIESSSGNFGVALAAYCKYYGLSFTCVIDPLISPANEQLITLLGANIIKVNKTDLFGGYLHTRINAVNNYIKENQNVYWINQYENPYNAEAYENTIGKEICETFSELDYVFIAVSSGGTITGISNCLKKKFPKIKIIAVDIEGSIVFGGIPQKRNIPGIGSSRVPPILQQAQIDQVIIVTETETINCCRKMLQNHCLFIGGSSGSIIAAIEKMERQYSLQKSKILAIFPDSGNRYTNTIYNDDWCKNYIFK